MSESHEPSTEPVHTETMQTTEPATTTTAGTTVVEVPPHDHPVSRLNKIAAWVGIVAGVVVVVAVIFGTGFMLGAHSGDHHRGGGEGHHGNSMEFRDGPPYMRPGFGPGGPGGFGPGGPGGFGPGQGGYGPGGQGPGQGGPGQGGPEQGGPGPGNGPGQTPPTR